MKGHKMFITSILGIFVLLSTILFFAYFYPYQANYEKIAQLPSHNLSLFRDEYDRVRYYYPAGSYVVFEYDFEKEEITRDGYSQFLIYNGEIINDRDDLFRVLNDDKLRSWNGKHYYFYDAENNLFMVYDNEPRDLTVSFDIKEYNHSYMLHTYNPPPFTRALKSGPLMFLLLEMIDVRNEDGDVSEARSGILAHSPPDEVIVSPLCVSLQIALVFTLYLIPLLFSLAYFNTNRMNIFITGGFYFLLFIFNAIYCLGSYPWISW